jgi:chromosome condensin MukBEF ATPase and DNA-binding subunit MukB
MIDPLTALSLASAAVGQMRELINAGRDTTQALTKFAGAWSDLTEAERRAQNPPWYKSLSSDFERQAAEAFAAKKKAEALKKDLENMIQFVHGPSGLEEYKRILRDMREQKRKHEFRKAEIIQTAIEWTVGLFALVVGVSVAGGAFYLIGKHQGKW